MVPIISPELPVEQSGLLTVSVEDRNAFWPTVHVLLVTVLKLQASQYACCCAGPL